MKKRLLIFVGLAGLAGMSPSALPAASPVIVHEWGTFTSLQDDNGRALGGINVDDEPVPDFVHTWMGLPVVAQYSVTERNIGLPPYSRAKSWTPGDPSVTLRLETPVLYVYPPAGQAEATVRRWTCRSISTAEC